MFFGLQLLKTGKSAMYCIWQGQTSWAKAQHQRRLAVTHEQKLQKKALTLQRVGVSQEA